MLTKFHEVIKKASFGHNELENALKTAGLLQKLQKFKT